jgi:hypothetical protein
LHNCGKKSPTLAHVSSCVQRYILEQKSEASFLRASERALNLFQGKEVRTAAVIQSNPEQSKHLETARLKISGLWIDLVSVCVCMCVCVCVLVYV